MDTTVIIADGRTLEEFFHNNGFETIDKRYHDGCLWVVGSKSEIEPYRQAAMKKFFCFQQGYASGRATRYRMGWWAKSPC